MISGYRYNTPIGEIYISDNGINITHLSFFGVNLPKDAVFQESTLIKETYLQLTQYFDGKRTQFALPLDPAGTQFQKRVWDVLLTIPFGTTKCYSEVATLLGNTNASRAVGMANFNNPIAIIIPCHRVIGKNGKLTGYAAGIEIKEKLLRLENHSGAF